MTRRIHFAAMTAIGLFSALAVSPINSASAQEVSDADSDATIIVTARRREERLSDVPVAVSVIGGAELERKNVFSLLDIQKTVPSLGITASNGRSNSANIMLRGQRQSDNTIFADPAVQVYINEVNSPRSSGLDTTAFDLESVQVLKGPQGTLFGRNSTGGALLLTTRKPGREVGGYMRAYLEDPSAAGFEGAVDLPLNEVASIRLAGNYQYRKGYTRVVAPGDILNTAPFNTTLAGAFVDVNQGQNVDDKNRWVGRATLDFHPSDAVRSTFVAERFKSNENGVGTFSNNYIQGFTGNPTITNGVINQGYPQAFAQAQALGWHETTASKELYSRYEMQSYSNVTTIDLSDNLVLKNVIGWRKMTGEEIIDQDGTFANININGPAFNGAKSFSEELQLQGNAMDKRLEWVVGGFLFKESGYDDVHTFTFKAPTGSYTNNKYRGRNKSRSAFAHASYELISGPGRTRIFGGVRYTHDNRELDFQSRSVSATDVVTCSVFDDAGVRLPGTACSLTRDASFNKATWQLGVDHQVMPDSLIYATIGTGYRSGGFNGRATTAAQRVPFRTETVLNYELGTKLALDVGGTRLTADLAGYYTDYKAIQRTVQINNTPNAPVPTIGSSIVNAANARIWGFEGEFRVRPIDILTLAANFSYTNARYKKFIETNPVTGVVTDRSANRFFGVAPWKWGASANLTLMDNDNGELETSATVSHSDPFEMNDLNVPNGRTDSVTIFDAYLNWNRMLGSPFSSGLYVKNLFDKEVISSGLILTGSLEVAQVQRYAPRVIGGMVRLEF